jgi:hypothetical protein
MAMKILMCLNHACARSRVSVSGLLVESGLYDRIFLCVADRAVLRVGLNACAGKQKAGCKGKAQ